MAKIGEGHLKKMVELGSREIAVLGDPGGNAVQPTRFYGNGPAEMTDSRRDQNRDAEQDIDRDSDSVEQSYRDIDRDDRDDDSRDLERE